MKIVIGGQLDKKEIAKMTREFFNDEVEVDIKGDLDATLALQNGLYDYYIGACNTGGGGALAMAVSLLGLDKTATISMPGKVMSDEKIDEEVKKGKIAFGFTASDRDQVLPVLLKSIKEYKGI